MEGKRLKKKPLEIKQKLSRPTSGIECPHEDMSRAANIARECFEARPFFKGSNCGEVDGSPILYSIRDGLAKTV